MTVAATGFDFLAPDAGWWFAAVAVVVALLAARAAWRRRARAAFAEAPLLARIAPEALRSRGLLRDALFVCALVAIVLALMDPRGTGGVEQVEQRGVDAMVVVDVSRSMLAEDAAPDRLVRAKQFALDLVDALASDRVGLIEFAGVPAMRCPLTFNHRAFASQLETLSPQSTVRGGSMLGDAIRMASSALADSPTGKVIVVLTDGEDMESDPVEAAATAAADHGIRTVTIGIGDSAEGARIPIPSREGKRYLVHEGREVWTRMDPTLLRSVADAGDGFFVEAGTGQVDMREVADAMMAGLEQAGRERVDVSSRTPLFQWFAGLALLLLVVEGLVLPARGPIPPTAAPESNA